MISPGILSRRSAMSVLAGALALPPAARAAAPARTAPAAWSAPRRTAKKPRLLPVHTDIKLAKNCDNPWLVQVKEPCQDEYTLRLNARCFENHCPDDQDGTPARFALLCYNDKAVGPTMRVRRGATVRVHLKNDLRLRCADLAESMLSHPRNMLLASEQPHGLAVTNLHTHGLHVSPDGGSDNVFVSIHPLGDDRPRDGQAPLHEVTFTYKIPCDHPAGTFWYHPHKHGSVAYQLSNGLAGPLIVEG